MDKEKKKRRDPREPRESLDFLLPKVPTLITAFVNR